MGLRTDGGGAVPGLRGAGENCGRARQRVWRGQVAGWYTGRGLGPVGHRRFAQRRPIGIASNILAGGHPYKCVQGKGQGGYGNRPRQGWFHECCRAGAPQALVCGGRTESGSETIVGEEPPSMQRLWHWRSHSVRVSTVGSPFSLVRLYVESSRPGQLSRQRLTRSRQAALRWMGMHALPRIKVAATIINMRITTSPTGGHVVGAKVTFQIRGVAQASSEVVVRCHGQPPVHEFASSIAVEPGARKLCGCAAQRLENSPVVPHFLCASVGALCYCQE